jgi:hypothetical protein
VPAKIDVRFSPTWIAWTGTTTISGRLVGGYIPPDGVALRLLTGSRRSPIVLHALRTNSRGTFRFSWGFGTGGGIARYPLWIATLSTETDYPYAASSSRATMITFGGHPPRAAPRPHRRGRKHRGHRH